MTRPIRATRRRSSAAGPVVLILVSLVALVVAEAALRWLDGQPLGAVKLHPKVSWFPRPPRQQLANVAKALVPTPGLDPGWIDAQIPELTNRSDRDPEALGRIERAQGWGGMKGDLVRVWNARWAEQDGCVPGGALTRLPVEAWLFDPVDDNIRPTYRFPPNRTLPSHLVTNRFGWRGDDLSLNKPPATVRIAFVGASTTLGSHFHEHAYPEYVVHWLNLWAENQGLSVRFDGINAAREGIGSEDIAAIVETEIMAMEPDLIVYYEGANQFHMDDLLEGPVDVPTVLGSKPTRALADFLKRFEDHSVVTRRLAELAIAIAERGGVEPPHVNYELRWPKGVDEFEPDLESSRLPVSLPDILADLRNIETMANKAGADLALGSFVWLVSDGMRVNPLTKRGITRFYQRLYAPFRYADIRRLADFQNRVLESHARQRGLWFFDLAALFPKKPGYFVDGIHLTEAGVRLQAWIVLAELLPRIRQRLESGMWPRPDILPLQTHPGIGPIRTVERVCPEN